MTKFIKPCALLLALLLLFTGCGENGFRETASPADVTASVEQTTVPDAAITVEAAIARETTEPEKQAEKIRYLLKTQTYFDISGEIQYILEYEYDTNGRCLGYQSKTLDGTVTDSVEYEYSQDGSYRDRYNEASGFVFKTREYMNVYGEITKLEQYTNEELTKRYIYENGYLIQMDEQASSTFMELDERGNEIREITRYAGGEEKVVDYSNLYDPDGRLSATVASQNGVDLTRWDYTYAGTRITEVKTNLTDGKTTTTITDYDEHHNEIEYIYKNDLLSIWYQSTYEPFLFPG